MQWKQIIRPATVNIILGKKGSGKSALGYWLIDTMAQEYALTPTIVGFPKGKQHLLPQDYVVKSLDEALTMENAILLVDEGTTMIPAGQRLDELVKSFIALSRQRNQLILFIFHASRDVGSKIMRGIDIIIAKQPSQRQIEYGAKTSWFKQFLMQAKSAFNDIKGDRRRFAYVDSEEPEFRGMLPNPIPSFWSEDLSKAWGSVSLDNGGKEKISDDEYVQRKCSESQIQEGEGLSCRICNKTVNLLISEVCESCFRDWMLSTRTKTKKFKETAS